MLPTLDNKSDSLEWKWGKGEEPQEPQEPRHTRGIRVDYQPLQNPFPDEDDDANKVTYTSQEKLFAIIARDEVKSLTGAKNSPNGQNGTRQFKLN
jgi:hypothetical protein